VGYLEGRPMTAGNSDKRWAWHLPLTTTGRSGFRWLPAGAPRLDSGGRRGPGGACQCHSMPNLGLHCPGWAGRAFPLTKEHFSTVTSDSQHITARTAQRRRAQSSTGTGAGTVTGTAEHPTAAGNSQRIPGQPRSIAIAETRPQTRTPPADKQRGPLQR
jgi:hypothetical protein